MEYPSNSPVTVNKTRDSHMKLFFGNELVKVPQQGNEPTNVTPPNKQRAEFINRLVQNWVHIHP